MLNLNHSEGSEFSEIKRRQVLKASGSGFFVAQFLDDRKTTKLGQTLFAEVGVTHIPDTELEPPHIDQFSLHSISKEKGKLYIFPLAPNIKKKFKNNDAIQSAGDYRPIPGKGYGRNLERQVYLELSPQKDPYKALPIRSRYYLPAINVSKRGAKGEIAIKVEGRSKSVQRRSEAKIKLTPREVSVSKNYVVNPGDETGTREFEKISVTPEVHVRNYGKLETRVINDG